MRLVRYSLAAVGLSTLLLGVVFAYAIVGPMPQKSADANTWTTVVIKN
jgi:flagellar motor component MotA